MAKSAANKVPETIEFSLDHLKIVQILSGIPFTILAIFLTIANLLAIGVAILLDQFTSMNPFGEGGLITLLCALQLLVTAKLSYNIYKRRGGGKISLKILLQPQAIWVLVSLGFVFLALDDLFKIHENIDFTIHSLLAINENAFSDRIDDLIILVYAAIGIGALVYYRQELKKTADKFSFFVTGFVLLFGMVLADIVTNRNDILFHFFATPTAKTLKHWLSTGEESMKLLAVLAFLLAFCLIADKQKQALRNT